MATQHGSTSFKVLDAFPAPHTGTILRLRLQEGEAPTLKDLRGSNLRAEGPDGESCDLKVEGFALFGGKASDARLARTGRIDVHASKSDQAGPTPGLQWTVRLT